ncbi:Replication protein A 70 kDa DNA-binding subunit [Arachis hypogaea]|nr:Replication protein A 70 kDa DNA-binding subunit [Arachis hypogaea]
MLGMNNRVDLVEKITLWRESWKVHVKVVKLWYHKNPALDPFQNLLHMVLMDEKLHKIQATIRDQLTSNFAVSLNEGDVYLMTHFTVVPNTGLNRVTKHQFRLLFQCKTSVVSVVSLRILHSGLCFTSIDEIDQRTKDDNFLINFIGIITGVRKERDVASYGKLIKAVVLEVFSDGKKLQYNVFGNACDLLEYDNLQKYPRYPLIVLESFKIKAIEGGVILQNVINVSRLFINPDIPEFSVASYGFLRLVTNVLGCLVSKVDGHYFNGKEISNIQNLHADNGDGHYFVIGTIKEVMDKPDWWYYSCVCGHAVVEHEDLYLCDACGSCIEHVMVKYGIRVKIHHGGCDVLFVLLDNAVRRSYSPHMFDDVVGEKKVFKVAINSAVDRDYSGPVGYEMNRSVYIVQQIWDDASVINVFEAAAVMNEHKIHVLVDSIREVEDAFSQCESDHEPVEGLHAF